MTKTYLLTPLTLTYKRDSLSGYQIEEVAKIEGPLKEITEREVEAALKAMKKGKAAGPSGVTSDLLKAAGEVGKIEMANIMNERLFGAKISEDWTNSFTIPIYRGKGDAMEGSKYRGVRLLEHGMKAHEHVLEKRLRDLVDIGKYQFAFCKGRSTTGAIFILRMLQEKYSQKKKKLYHVFVDLEKAFDRVPRKVIEWALRRKGIPEQMVAAIMAWYMDSKTRVKTMAGISKELDILVGVHQGSVLSLLLFIVVMDEVTKEIRKGVPWELMFADDLALTKETKEKVEKVFDRWSDAMESKGLKVNMEKTKMM
jgi:Reverse transcriptase (RNA-dependent DNA polymerase)